MGNLKTIYIDKYKNPHLYKAIKKKGGTVRFKYTIMTIFTPKASIWKTFVDTIKKATKKYV